VTARLSRLGRLAALAVAAGALPLLAGPSAHADTATDPDCQSVSAESPFPQRLHSASRPLAEMGVLDAQGWLKQRGIVAGQGVTVAVIDSGVAPGTPVNLVAPTVQIGAQQPVQDYHGTDVASLIAGQPRSAALPVGVAPGAQIYDVQIFDSAEAAPGSDETPILADNVAKALRDVLQHVTQYDIKVVNISLSIPDSTEVAGLIQQLWDAGVVTVAPTGNRPGADNADPDAAPSSVPSFNAGENAADQIHPADYPDVLAVNATTTGLPAGTAATTYVLQNSATRLAAPTAFGVAYNVTGGTCVNSVPATSWAAAEVSGVLALEQSWYDESPARAVARLLNTADGRTDVPNDLVGAGEVQAYAALTRPLQMDDDGTVLDAPVAQAPTQRVAAPTPPPDLLASTRRHAVWWGLVGGGALVLALVLRPVLARRRTH
jgi:membrane-anchored mycosin MYCP